MEFLFHNIWKKYSISIEFLTVGLGEYIFFKKTRKKHKY
mgnify:CR=1 FL=1